MSDTERERESTRQKVLSQSSVKLSGFDAVEFVFIAYFSRIQSESLTVVFVNDEQLSGHSGSLRLVRFSSSMLVVTVTLVSLCVGES